MAGQSAVSAAVGAAGPAISWPRALRRALGGLALLVLVGIAGGIALAAASRASPLSPPSHAGFPGWLAGPLDGVLAGATRDRQALANAFGVGVLAMCAAYLVALACVRDLPARWVLGAIVVAHLAFLLAPPLSLTDVFNYLGYARLGVVHHLNPYVQIPRAARTDPYYHFSNWHRLRSPYGPLFTLGTYPLALLPVPVAYWLFKVAVTAASLGMLALLWACARRLGRSPVAAVALVGLNPPVLVYGLGGQHNEVFMTLFVVAGVYLLLRGREAWSGAALVGAVAIKASAGLFAPAVALAARRRLRAAAGAAVAGAAVAAATLVAFGPHLPNLGQQSRLVAPLSGPNLLGFALGRGGADAQVRRACVAAAVLAAVVAGVVAWRRRDAVTPAGWAGLAGLLALSWVIPWYVLWVLPFAALSASRALRGAVLVVSVYLAFVWSPLMPGAIHHLGFYPTRTAVGKANHLYIQELLRDSLRAPRHPRLAAADRGLRAGQRAGFRR